MALDELGNQEAARSDPDALFLGRDQVTLDEVQREPDLLLAVKRAVDADRRPGRFLLTGSANLLLMRRASETLAGRAVYCHLPVLTWAEIEGGRFGANLDLLLRESSLDVVLRGQQTSSGHEVDFVLEAGRRLLPIEVKAASRPRRDDARGLDVFLDSYPEAPFGVLACCCSEPRALSSRVLAIPIEDLLLA